MPKSADAFRTISEVADWLETPAHVLRFWESKFTQVKPVKRAGGRRYYRPADMELLGGIKKLLHDDGMTIKGVQKILREQGVKHVSDMSQPLDDVTAELKADLEEVRAKVVEPETGTVLSFERTVEEPPAATPEAASDPASIPEAQAPDAVSDTPELDDTTAPPPEPLPPYIPPEPDPAPAPDMVKETPAEPLMAEPVETVGAAAADEEPEPAEVPDAVATADEAPAEEALPESPPLPSFLRAKPDADTESPAETPASAPEEIEPLAEMAPEAQSPEPSEEPSQEPEAAPAPKPALIELPDDPDDDALIADSLLAKILTIPRPVSPETAAALAPLRERLAAIVDARQK